MSLSRAFFLIIFVFLIIGIQDSALADYAYSTGNPYEVESGWPDAYRFCCPGSACITPPNCTQQYDYAIWGINYAFTGGSGYEIAPCMIDNPEPVIIKNNVQLHVAKFAFRLVKTGTTRCAPPNTRWENIPNFGGLIHASEDIVFFDGAG